MMNVELGDIVRIPASDILVRDPSTLAIVTAIHHFDGRTFVSVDYRINGNRRQAMFALDVCQPADA